LRKSELAHQPITVLRELFRDGSFEPEDLLDCLLENIRRYESKIHAYLHMVPEHTLREQARDASKELKNFGSRPLTGIFMAIKDNTYVSGLPCTAGSKILEGYIPLKDATAVSRLREQGAVFLGKTNLDEFAAFGIATNNPHFGRTFNPWNLGRIPGGSSGGSAAAVSAGEAVAATGSDTGGSVRIPASFCNLVGLKPTFGRISRSGTITMSWTLDHFGVIARTVRDASVLYEAMSGKDASDSSTLNSPELERSAFADDPPDLFGIKLGIFSNPIRASDDGVMSCFDESVRVLSEAGARIRSIELPDVEHITPAIFAIALSEVAAYHEEWFRTRREDYADTLRGYVQLGHTILATEYLKAQRARATIVERVSRKLAEVDVLLVPTNPSVAPELNQEFVEIRGKRYPAFQVLTENTYPFNLLGLPAMTIPNGFSNGLPVGLQLVCSHWKEDLLFKVGDCYQQLTDYHKKTPAVPL